MDTLYMLFLFLLASTAGTVVYILALAPKRKKRLWFVGEGIHELVLLRDEYEIALRALKDLEASHEAGKLEGDEYRTIYDSAMLRARESKQELEAFQTRAKDAKDRLERDLTNTSSEGRAS